MLRAARWLFPGALALVFASCSSGAGGPGSCEDACFPAPAPFCDGDSLVTYSAIGECIDGECVWAVASTAPCDAGCVDGACVVVVDPCDGVDCETPPAAECDGEVAVAWASPGVCDEATGECAYSPVRTDCEPRGQVCRDGRCVVPGLCDDVTCATPPAAECRAGSLVTYDAAGSCDDATGDCTYAETVARCAAGSVCREGACVEVPPCEGVECSTPPSARCEGTTAVVFSGGACNETSGACAYERATTDCAADGLVCVSGACVEDPRCAGVVCTRPPRDECRGSQVYTWAEAGVCVPETGRCAYDEVPGVDCADSGELCERGECVSTVCVGVVCASPPDNACDGDVLVQYSSLGTCADDTCSYPSERIDCAATGEACQAGACVPRDPCESVSCDATPPPYCQGDVLVAATGSGVCVDGLCEFGESTVNCTSTGRVCRDGACADACSGVACDEPPASWCDEDTLVSYATTGTCAGGACSYRVTRTGCFESGQICVDGACVADPCTVDTCAVPPAPLCEGDVRVIPRPNGLCSRGECTFADIRENCATRGLVCADGVCVGICDTIECNDPPPASCVDDTLISWGVGTCEPATGGCSYAPTPVNCASSGRICLGGACVEDPCLSLTCNTPPAPACEGDTLVEFRDDGICERGTCSYARVTSDCSLTDRVCRDGACRDRCDGVTCDDAPAPRCVGDTAVGSLVPGTCNAINGACSYDTASVNCALGGEVCRDGLCVPPPCEGVSCDETPAPFCDGDLLVTSIGTGVCDEWDGSCDFATVEQDCLLDGGPCVDGVCAGRCFGVTCDEPPPAFCSGTVAYEYVDEGTCRESDGTCRYAAAASNCAASGQVCEDGVCVDPPCTGVTCNTPPAPYCEGNTLRTPQALGVCLEATGECDYGPFSTDCSLGGGSCQDGACRDRCYGVACNEPPADYCLGTVAYAHPIEGACSVATGECIYAPTVQNCATDGRLCLDGACIEPPCLGVVCDVPPAPTCEGSVRVEAFGVGACQEFTGECSFSERRTDCSLDGGSCVDGVCRDRCFGVVCDEPPADVCSGTVALDYSAPGVCNAASGLCEYEPVGTNCDTIGQVCVAGACIVDPCLSTTCDTPPAAYCDGNIARAPFAPGVCQTGLGTCNWPELVRDCAAFDEQCVDGACVGFCFGVACDTPPAPDCVGNTAYTYVSPGLCREPTADCEYDRVAVNCGATGQICDAGACVDPPCTGVVCDEPPAPVCDGNVLVTAFGPGSCQVNTGECGYGTFRSDCSGVGTCADGRCVPRCEGVVCERPAPYCDGNSAIAFDAGVCDPATGECNFLPIVSNCAGSGDICVDGACVDNPCDALGCDVLPAPVCEGSVVVRTVASTCDPFAAECVLQTEEVDCASQGLRCIAGQCANSCFDVTCDEPPANACIADIAVVYSASGVCNDSTGTCAYGSINTNCALTGQQCVAGSCVANPCAGVVCGATPAPRCEDGVSVRFVDGGICNRDTGVCEFVEQRSDCEAAGLLCEAGQCRSRCEGVICDEPGEAYCIGDNAVVPNPIGLCLDADGSCVYAGTSTDCTGVGQVCRSGACVPDPCDGVVCATPPQDTCVANTALLYSAGVSECVDGDCEYIATAVDCTSLGLSCIDGNCRNACFGVTCPATPTPFCEGGVVVTSSGAGVCDPRFGVCGFDESYVNCNATGERCLDGACVPGLCGAGSCADAPDDVCSGNVLTAYTVGSCDPQTGSCEFDSTTTDCAAIGLRCLDGACRDLCYGVSCDELGSATCQGDTRVVPTGGGACDARDGSCIFSENTFENCRDSGRICEGGVCVADPCLGVVCDDPPATVCRGNTRVTYRTDIAACQRDVLECVYPEQLLDCTPFGQTCLDGDCRDACYGVTCDDPPDAACSGDVLLSYGLPSSCRGTDGACSYTVTPRDCAATGEMCVAGACVPDPCFGVSCDEPPDDVCSGDMLLLYGDSVGVCDRLDGLCDYPPTTLDCAAIGLTCEDAGCRNACYGVECGPPPAPVCEDDRVISFVGEGECNPALGSCVFDTVADDCAARGLVCEDGACVADPCLGVACDELPDTVCSGQVLLVYGEFSGACTRPDGDCEYTPDPIDCAQLGLTCADNDCRDACYGVTCGPPPPSVCTGNVVVSYAGPGVCQASSGECVYPVTTDDCAARGELCEDGACVPDPCFGRACDSPPPTVCEGDLLITYTGGSCNVASGACVYSEQSVDCASLGYRCEDAGCRDACYGVTCSDPPPAICIGDLVVSYQPDGSCLTGGTCGYNQVLTDCRDTGERCRLGSCEDPNSCVGLFCDEAPPSFCRGNIRVDFELPGTCLSGTCSFDEIETDCALTGEFCLAGACVADDPCEGLVCDQVLSGFCGGATAVRLEWTGGCETGNCLYEQIAEGCGSADACSDGYCIDPCTGVTCNTPPAPVCSGNTRITFAAAGSCADGNCQYAVGSEFDCTSTGQFCVDGACVATDPCLGVSCAVPPAPFCSGDFVITATGAGTCDAGNCRFLTTVEDCAASSEVCVDGECVPNECAGITCETPPAPSCASDTVALQPDATGTCAGGVCSYSNTLVDCAADGGACVDGYCISLELCGAVVCDTPPAPFCVGNSAVWSRLPSLCVRDECVWAETVEDCAADGGLCVDGACATVDLCDGVTCNTPPAPSCRGNTVVTYSLPGVCAFGTCSYELSTTTDCSATGRFCFAGACQGTDPCAGIVCDDAPSEPYCVGYRAFQPVEPGLCQEGDCVYPTLVQDCRISGQVCDNGECVGVCDGVVCDTPPAPRCDGTVALRSLAVGSCSTITGACDYPAAPPQDCSALGLSCIDGLCIDPDAPREPGDLEITEVMLSASGGGQWVELENRSGRVLVMDRTALFNELGQGVGIGPALEVPVGGRVLVARAGTVVPGGADAEWDPAEFGLSAPAGTLRVLLNSELDTISYTAAWPFAPGVAAQLSSDALDNNNVDNWCPATSLYDGTNRGTPGGPNFVCE